MMHDPSEPKSAVAAPPARVAAIDLGSNSFHMVIAHLRAGVPQVVDRIREQVQLAAGLDAKRRLDRDVRERALAALDLFAQRLGTRKDLLARAVGTNTLRLIRDDRSFVAEAERRLGLPIEIVSGDEEARLVYLGVAHGVSPGEGGRLVVDIGGGSTECILGRGFETIDPHSVPMGCISWSRRFFADGRLDRARFDRAVLAAERELHEVARAIRSSDWSEAIGSSGTIRSVEDVVRANGAWDDGFDRAALDAVVARLLEAKSVDDIALKGLKDQRAAIFAGGLAIIVAVFESLKVKRMKVSPTALREGVIYDLIGRIAEHDIRERTVRDFESRFGIDGVQAARVEATAAALLEHVAARWDLEDPACGRMLRWAARLHEVGLALSHDRYHRHGAYIVGNARMPGFSRDEQELLAALLLNQRRNVKADTFRDLAPRWKAAAPRLAAVLRIAIVLNRSRRPADLSALRVEVTKKGFVLVFREAWLDAHPLTRLDLEQEMEAIDAAGIRLEVVVE
ncbi:MAG: Ppx/GppA phosphatase family protein [Planctomycetota bacterium]